MQDKSYKNTEQLSFMNLNSDTNVKTGSLHFDGLLLSKAFKDLHEEVQKSYVS